MLLQSPNSMTNKIPLILSPSPQHTTAHLKQPPTMTTFLYYTLTNMYKEIVNTPQQQTQICTKECDLILLRLLLHILDAY